MFCSHRACLARRDPPPKDRGPVYSGGRVTQPDAASLQHMQRGPHRDRVAGAGYACNARPDLHTICRSLTKSVQPITTALARVAEDAQRERRSDHAPKPALVVLVDQFEELFAQGISESERAAWTAPPASGAPISAGLRASRRGDETDAG
jgi:hypothetical protein